MSLDDLLTAARDHREEPDPGDLGVVSLAKVVALGAVLGFAAYQLILLFDYRVPYLLLFSVGAALMLAKKISYASHGEPQQPHFVDHPPQWTHHPVDDRLRLRHGVDRQRDPKRARELLGEQLWAFVAEPVTRAPDPRQLAALAEQIEHL